MNKEEIANLIKEVIAQEESARLAVCKQITELCDKHPDKKLSLTGLVHCENPSVSFNEIRMSGDKAIFESIWTSKYPITHLTIMELKKLVEKIA